MVTCQWRHPSCATYIALDMVGVRCCVLDAGHTGPHIDSDGRGFEKGANP